MIYTKQPNKLQRGLCTPLDAIAYTNEVLVVSAMIGAMFVLLLVAFSGNIDTMSTAIGKINEVRQDALKEKIDVVSAETIGSKTTITFTNYGKTDSKLLGFYVDGGVDITKQCTSNNKLSSDMRIPANSLLEVTCNTPSKTTQISIATSTHNILVVQL